MLLCNAVVRYDLACVTIGSVCVFVCILWESWRLIGVYIVVGGDLHRRLFANKMDLRACVPFAHLLLFFSSTVGVLIVWLCSCFAFAFCLFK